MRSSGNPPAQAQSLSLPKQVETIRLREERGRCCLVEEFMTDETPVSVLSLEESGSRPLGALQAQAPQKHKSIVGRDRLIWREDSGGLSLHHRHSRAALVRVEPDGKRRRMFRVCLPDGGITDIANLSRAKDAALAIALRLLNSQPQETALRGSHVRQKQREVGNPRSLSAHAPSGARQARGRS